MQPGRRRRREVPLFERAVSTDKNLYEQAMAGAGTWKEKVQTFSMIVIKQKKIAFLSRYCPLEKKKSKFKFWLINRLFASWISSLSFQYFARCCERNERSETSNYWGRKVERSRWYYTASFSCVRAEKLFWGKLFALVRVFLFFFKIALSLQI